MGMNQVERILVIKMSSLGDILAALPALNALRTLYPQAHITWAVQREFASILPSTPWIDEVVEIERANIRRPKYWRELAARLRPEKFDLVIDWQMIAKSALVAWLSGGKRKLGYWEAREGSGWISRPIRGEHAQEHITERLLDVVRYLGYAGNEVEYPLPDVTKEKEELRRRLRQEGVGEEFLIFAPGTRGAGKMWPLENWHELAERLNRDGRDILVIGSANEKVLAQAVCKNLAKTRDWTGRTNLRELMALEQMTSLHVSGDTGPLHIANAVRAPLLGLYGPTHPARSGPYANPRAAVITLRDNPQEQQKKLDHIRMEDISVEQVYAKVIECLQ